ncbi:hypothetical protein C7974DRAFT_450324 [Boeremia exigua]|uniref:uncharacterized protein n=1 Tax=Boeremia exigua TaxID=749465 RepID=UPI001E8D1719|nr:uncharacterized protein C7974DRAFT_450324 [Boeremia exigua]KAH6637429.1 hypothetical protein C7974DRAFT_450324 [Boeremia exigua]
MTTRHNHTAFPWLLLPADIRLLVLDEISGQKNRGWAQGAAVCKEWQAVLEPKNFSQLTVQLSCLDGLETLVIRQRPLVRRICFYIELPRYGCHACYRSKATYGQTSALFRKAILRLFSILSTWQPAGQLILELSASSPSDSQHWFKNYCFGPGHEDTTDWTEQERALRWHDPKHGWIAGYQAELPDPEAFLRLFSPLCSSVPKTLPIVQAVTSFCIRRQLRHELFPRVLEALWEKLPRLESIVYELWRARRHFYYMHMQSELASLFESSVPKHVKRVSIFRDFNDQLTLASYNDQLTLASHNATIHLNLDSDVGIIPAVPLRVTRAFAARSPHLEHLSISHMIDAQLFFTLCQCPWPLLQSLTLTASTLARRAPRQHIYTLLRNASTTALTMPRLSTMVLWNSEPRHACALMYQRHTASAMATLTWRGTWNLELPEDVVASWKKVAGLCYLRLEKEALHDVDIRSHGDAIHHLRLPDGVADPVSLYQIRHEGMLGVV